MAYIVKAGSQYVGIARNTGFLSGREFVIRGGYELVDSLDKAEPIERLEEAVQCAEFYAGMEAPDGSFPGTSVLEYH